MATESILVSALIPASPEAVYDAWLSSEQHSEMTGGGAHIEPHVGGSHRAWDNYISGKTLELEPGKRIVQSWRSTQFPSDSGDSQIVITLAEENGQTRIEIAHTDIPEGQGPGYQSGWDEHYFGPMAAYFAGAGSAAKKAARKPAAKKAAPKKTAKKAAPKRGAAKKTAKKAAPKRGAAKKTAKKAAPKRGAAKKTARKTAAKKTAKKAAPKRGAAKKTAKKRAAKKTAR